MLGNHHNIKKMKKRVIDTTTNQIINSVKEASDLCNLEYSYFIKMLKGKIYNSTVFKYYDEKTPNNREHPEVDNPVALPK